jgi:hypothetical protein
MREGTMVAGMNVGTRLCGEREQAPVGDSKVVRVESSLANLYGAVDFLRKFLYDVGYSDKQTTPGVGVENNMKRDKCTLSELMTNLPEELNSLSEDVRQLVVKIREEIL